MSVKFSLNVEHGDAGLWYVTSPEIKGIFIASKTLGGALEQVPEVCAALIEAYRAGPVVNADRSLLERMALANSP